MNHVGQIKIPATYYRSGTSKGVFFSLNDLPEAAQVPGEVRDRLLLRVIGSPDPYGKQTDGMGGGTSSTSKAVILSRSERDGHDVDYLFGQVAIDCALVDWSGNCGNMTSAVGGFAIRKGLIDQSRIPENGTAVVRIWQANIQKTIIAYVTMRHGEVQETGDFELDGVTFPSAEVVLEFLDPAGGGVLFPTGRTSDTLDVPGVGSFNATLINAGTSMIFLKAQELGYLGTEAQDAINNDAAALARFEKIRAHGAVTMGLIHRSAEAARRQHTPKLAFCAPAQSYTASNGQPVHAESIDLCVRAISMGKVHHAMMGTAAVAIATAAAIPGTVVHQVIGGGHRSMVCCGHSSGLFRVGAEVSCEDGRWIAQKAVMSRSARVLMEGWVSVPGDCF